jgi:hypothetical protein
MHFQAARGTLHGENVLKRLGNGQPRRGAFDSVWHAVGVRVTNSPSIWAFVTIRIFLLRNEFMLFVRPI